MVNSLPAHLCHFGGKYSWAKWNRNLIEQLHIFLKLLWSSNAAAKRATLANCRCTCAVVTWWRRGLYNWHDQYHLLVRSLDTAGYPVTLVCSFSYLFLFSIILVPICFNFGTDRPNFLCLKDLSELLWIFGIWCTIFISVVSFKIYGGTTFWIKLI